MTAPKVRGFELRIWALKREIEAYVSDRQHVLVTL